MQISQILKNLFAAVAKETKRPSAALTVEWRHSSPEAEIIHIGQAALRHCPGLLSSHSR